MRLLPCSCRFSDLFSAVIISLLLEEILFNACCILLSPKTEKKQQQENICRFPKEKKEPQQIVLLRFNLSLTYEKATPKILPLYYIFIKNARKTRFIIRASSHIISVQFFLRFASRLSKRLLSFYLSSP